MKRPPGNEARDRQRSLRTFSTDAERLLWSKLRGRRLEGFKFRRQVWLGNYVVDFVCVDQRLVVEADGGQHAEQADYDDRRTAFLEKEGFRVLRFWNNDVLTNLDGVVTVIMNAMRAGPHPPKPAAWAPPSPLKGEGF
jgi:very-short-patch-repair endonuclease